MKKLYLIDGYGFVFRAFHSMPPLSRPDGTPIGAVYGFCNMLMKLLLNHEADMLAVVLDSGQKTFRHEIFPDYKSNRPSPPEELIVQFPIIREAVEAFNVSVLEKQGFEADDLIATYTRLAKEQNIEVKIISSDKDLMQLIDETTSMYDAMKDKSISFNEVVEKFGVRPSQVQDMLSLIGDSSDHIPGVRGIGQKTASELLNQFNTLDGIYNNLDKIEQKRRKQLLEDGKESAYLSKKLVALDDKVEHKTTLEDLKVKDLDNQKLADFISIQGFKSLLNRINATAVQSKEPTVKKQYSETVYKKISNIDELKNLNAKIRKAGYLSILATKNEIQLSFDEYNISLDIQEQSKQESLFDEPQNSNSLTYCNVILALKESLESTAIRKIGHDIKFIMKKANECPVTISSIDDVAVMSYAIDTGKHKCDLATLLKVYLGEEFPQNSNNIYLLYKKLHYALFEAKHVELYESIDRKLISTLSRMELRGVLINQKILIELSRQFSIKLKELEQKIFEEAKEEFNIGSPKQLGEILFVKLGIAGGKKSKTGAYATGAEVLEKLIESGHNIATLVSQWRQYSKLINTYTEALQKSINPKTGRVHTTFTMTETSTGRLSSIDPNLQNIPIRTDEGHRIREAFTARDGHIIISADYSQIELRLLAEVANIQEMKDAFKNDLDIHAITASQMFGVPVDKVDSNLRRKAKTINFGIIYGISAFGLSARLGIDRTSAKNYIESYFKQYPGIKEYMEKTIQFAKANGYVETIFKRRCHINGINDKNFALRGLGERAAINAPLQSAASDIIKKAMVKMPKEIEQYMVLQIHDELLFEVPIDKADIFKTKIRDVMENVLSLSVPLKVDVNSGKSWAESH